MTKTYSLPNEIDELEQDAYAAGLQRALNERYMKTKGDDIEGMARDLARAAYSETETNDMWPLFYDTYSVSFSIGYADAVIMRRDKPEQYEVLVLNTLEQTAYCYLLAHIWYITKKHAVDAIKNAWLSVSSELQN